MARNGLYSFKLAGRSDWNAQYALGFGMLVEGLVPRNLKLGSSVGDESNWEPRMILRWLHSRKIQGWQQQIMITLLSRDGLEELHEEAKRTFVQCISGRKQPDEGQIRVFGRDPATSKSTFLGSAIGVMQRLPDFHALSSVQEILSLYGQLHGMPDTLIKGRLTKVLDCSNRS